jgi:hypothetical protein
VLPTNKLKSWINIPYHGVTASRKEHLQRSSENADEGSNYGVQEQSLGSSRHGNFRTTPARRLEYTVEVPRFDVAQA